MNQKGLTSFFEEYLSEKSLFINKKALQSSFTPEQVLHRQKQIEQIAEILAPLLKKERPSNLFLYGKTGTGKTLTIKHITAQMINVAKEKQIPIKLIYLNCKLKRVADTEYRLIAQIIRLFGRDVPVTGLPTDEVYNLFFNILENAEISLLLILDEIDQLIKKTGDEIIYNLTRINSELKKAQISLVGISNSLIFTQNLDPRVKSSLSEEEVIFSPYNALQIQDILKKRVDLAFKSNTLQQGVIEKCAAYAAREHGDARRAIELLRVAGELAERKKKKLVDITDLDEAQEKIEKDRILDIIKSQPKQSQSALFCIVNLFDKNKQKIYTGEIYELYKKLCINLNLRPLTQRRITDIIAELDMLGVINANVVSKGRYGRTKEISIAFPISMVNKIQKILQTELGLD
ncbi:ORC1-type DNA replication protein [Candidatus Woesearchaeota archaeon]|nr:ORC1-type DNA replication protein [Candidatus Woesearchaeota archaeon]